MVYRDERKGELGGLSRVRAITQDDSHVFCTEEQIGDIFGELIESAKDLYKRIDMKLHLRLSFRDDGDGYIGTPEMWEKAQKAIKDMADKYKMDYFIGEGEADVLVSFETMEAMRCLPFLKPGGKVVVNTYEMPSLPVLSGECEYPDGIIDERKKRADTLALDAVKVASDLGMPRGMNVVLLGALIAALGVDDVDWAAALKSCVKRQFFEPNLKCLEAGLKLAGKTE